MSIVEIDPNLQELMEERYYQPGETNPQQMLRRVANFVAFGEKQYGWTNEQCQELADQYFEMFNNRLAIPSSPFLMNAGTKVPMLSACFAMGGLKDDMDSIFEALKRSARVWKMGGKLSKEVNHTWAKQITVIFILFM